MQLKINGTEIEQEKVQIFLWKESQEKTIKKSIKSYLKSFTRSVFLCVSNPMWSFI